MVASLSRQIEELKAAARCPKPTDLLAEARNELIMQAQVCVFLSPPLSLSLSVCLSVSLSLSLSIYIYIYLYISISIPLSRSAFSSSSLDLSLPPSRAPSISLPPRVSLSLSAILSLTCL